jgi:hypothetical protein
MSNSSNFTDPCLSGTSSLSTPRITIPGPYVAIGPISNFTDAITSCCGAYTNESHVSNYAGGTKPSSCYYYCSFNGTVEDMREVMACSRGAADERRREHGYKSGYLGLGSHPDLGDKSSDGASAVEGPRIGVWRSMVVGLAFFGAMAGTL